MTGGVARSSVTTVRAVDERTSGPQPVAGERRAAVAARPATVPAATARPAGAEPPQARADPLAGLLARAVSRRTLARKEIKNGAATFKVDPYRKHLPDEDGTDTQRQVGVEVGVEYVPPGTFKTAKIAFVQTIKATRGGAPFLLGKMSGRVTDASDGEAGWAVDRVEGRDSPNYGQNNDGTASGTITFGFDKQLSWWGKLWDRSVGDAKMWDYVKITRLAGQAVTCDAVSWAFDETNGTYLGGVSWGFATSGGGTTTLKEPALEAAGGPTGVHKAALERWNAQADLDEAQRNSPHQAKVVVP
jgi:hypothetical protein